MKNIARLILMILATASMKNLQADYTVQMNLDNNPRFHVELTLPEELKATVPQEDPNTFAIQNENGSLKSAVVFSKNEIGRASHEKWIELVKDSESKFPGRCLVDSPAIATPKLPGAHTTHSIIIKVNPNNSMIFGTIIIEMDEYVGMFAFFRGKPYRSERSLPSYC